MARRKADTSQRLVPTEPREIIRCTIIACLAVAVILGLPRIVAHIAQAMGVIG